MFSGYRLDGSDPLKRENGEALAGRFFQQSSWATHAIAREQQLAVVPEGIDHDLRGPLGCSISAGAGTMLNELRPAPARLQHLTLSIPKHGVIGAGILPIWGRRIASRNNGIGRAAMEQYVALDVSLKEISVCVIDVAGAVVFEGKTATDPKILISLIRAKAPEVVKVGLETGATSPWLYHTLKAAELPVVLMDARHAHAALSMRPTKSDRSDARGLAEILRMGWYREVVAKSFTSHERLALLAARRRLVSIRTDLDAQLRGLLKTFGLILGPGNTDALVRRAESLAKGHPVISALVARLAEVRRHVVAQVAALDRDIPVASCAASRP
jgi:hypothetical protein